MLSHLTVKNLAIVEEVSVSFGNGLNIITGETGAGKSVLMGALGLVLGGRSDKSAIREGANEASVEASFQLEDSRAVDALLDSVGLPVCEDKLLLVRRTVTQNGAGRCFVNDEAATVQTLRKLGALLVDIHGPYDHQSLLETTTSETCWTITAAVRNCVPPIPRHGALGKSSRPIWRHCKATPQTSPKRPTASNTSLMKSRRPI